MYYSGLISPRRYATVYSTKEIQLSSTGTGRARERGKNMKEYDIYDISSDEPGWGHYLGTVSAFDSEGAEWKACGMFPDIPSNYIAAFSKEEQ